MRLLVIHILFLIACTCSSQIVQTKEVASSLEREIAHLKELYRVEIDALKLAINTQNIEDKRRLEELNNHAAMVALMVTREEFDKFEDRTDEGLKEMQSWQDNMTGKLAVSVAIITLVMFGLNYFKKNTSERRT